MLLKLFTIFLVAISFILPQERLGTSDNYITEIAKKYGDAIVLIEVKMKGKSVSKQGSGVLVNDGKIIITNFHVVAGSKEVKITFNDNTETFVDRYLRADEVRDLVSIKLPKRHKVSNSVTIKTSDDVKIGEKVVAIGNPLGLTTTVSEGIISSKRNLGYETVVLQTTAPISHGSSGGGLFNSNGDLIGITTFSFKNSQNLNFAVPGEYLFPLLKNGRTMPFLNLPLDNLYTNNNTDYETVYVTKTGKKFHKIGCRYTKNSSVPTNINEAIISYAPCKICY